MSLYLNLRRYETTTNNVNETKEQKANSFSNTNGTATLDGFEQDPFALNKAQEAFSASTPDPFGSAFPSQPTSVSFFDLSHCYKISNHNF